VNSSYTPDSATANRGLQKVDAPDHDSSPS
jgi:hypothetical protein